MLSFSVNKDTWKGGNGGEKKREVRKTPLCVCVCSSSVVGNFCETHNTLFTLHHQLNNKTYLFAFPLFPLFDKFLHVSSHVVSSSSSCLFVLFQFLSSLSSFIIIIHSFVLPVDHSMLLSLTLLFQFYFLDCLLQIGLGHVQVWPFF